MLALKGQFLSKIKMLSSLTHPEVVQNLYKLVRILVTKQFLAPNDVRSFLFSPPYYGSQWGQPTFFKISSVVFNR